MMNSLAQRRRLRRVSLGHFIKNLTYLIQNSTLDVGPARNALKLVRGKFNNLTHNSTHYAWQAGVRRS
jgi:hypothetical protein